MATNEVERRTYWVTEIAKLTGSFGNDARKLIEELRAEISNEGVSALIDHIRLCGAVPEQYTHDSSEEKLYAKYTDAVVSESLAAMGLRSTVIDERADHADVQAHGRGFSLVADAKAFRLSRTAKNQKDFKVQAMHTWRRQLDYSLLVCPMYQLPSTTSQIYLQAAQSNVCILTYTHLAVMVGLAARRTAPLAQRLLQSVLEAVTVLQPSKSASDYWTVINRTMVESLGEDKDLWLIEKAASVEALQLLKAEALEYLTSERDRILGLSHQEALEELVRRADLNDRIAHVNRASFSQRLLQE